jgi:spoIIIJ-associated protein
MNVNVAAAKIDRFLKEIVPHSGLDLGYTIEIAETAPRIQVRFEGADVPLLLAQQAELLLALEHIAVSAIGLNSGDFGQVSFDAGGFKAKRDWQIQVAASNAIAQVRASGQPFRFPPMNARDRGLLSLALASSGLLIASVGEEPLRCLVLLPPAQEP